MRLVVLDHTERSRAIWRQMNVAVAITIGARAGLSVRGLGRTVMLGASRTTGRCEEKPCYAVWLPIAVSRQPTRLSQPAKVIG